MVPASFDLKNFFIYVGSYIGRFADVIAMAVTVRTGGVPRSASQVRLFRCGSEI